MACVLVRVYFFVIDVLCFALLPSYVFAVNAWISIEDGGQVFELVTKEKPLALKSRSLENIQYEVSVMTGDEKGAGTGMAIFYLPSKSSPFSY
jgi:hypothetical protein